MNHSMPDLGIPQLKTGPSTRVSIGSGEIIDVTSAPRQARNQHDIVIFRNDYPRIPLGGHIHAFLAESVIATIEVKSILTEHELEVAILSAGRAKALQRHIGGAVRAGYVPPGILSYVVAYAGPANINTVYTWLKRIEARHGLNQANLPATGRERLQRVSEFIEAIFCLGLGTITFDNSPVGLVTDAMRVDHPTCKYTVLSQTNGNVLFLFILITQAVSGTSLQMPQVTRYLDGHEFNIRFHP